MKKVLVLGATGMLGSMLVNVLSKKEDIHVVGTTRSYFDSEKLPCNWLFFDASFGDYNGSSLRKTIKEADWVINAIGVIKPNIVESEYLSVQRAIQINSLFPFLLAEAARLTNTQVIQIATDCVYSGLTGNYTESTSHDALDVYGKTKSLGEVRSPFVHHLRCSIIGPEVKGHKSLMDWFLSQPEWAVVSGYRNHFWNGVTTEAFAEVCYGVISNEINLPYLHHLIPQREVSKDTLLRSLASAFNREDIQINAADAPVEVNRVLQTENHNLNTTLWKATSYVFPPTVDAMIRRMGESYSVFYN